MKTWMAHPQKLDHSFTWTQLHGKMENSPFRMTVGWNVKYLEWWGRSINSAVIRIRPCTCLKNLPAMLRPCDIKKWMRPKRGCGFSKLLLGFISDFSFFLWMRSRSPPCFKVLAPNSECLSVSYLSPCRPQKPIPGAVTQQSQVKFHPWRWIHWATLNRTGGQRQNNVDKVKLVKTNKLACD